MRLKVFGDRVIIRCDAIEEKKIGSIFISDKHSERTRFATVLEVGDKVSGYLPGDRVMISWYTGSHLHIIGETFFGEQSNEDTDRLVREEEILGKVLPD